MGVNAKGRDRHGKQRVVVSKRWPDGSRFRRYVPNSTVGKKTLARIEESIAMGTWRTLKEELQHEPDTEHTVRSFAPVYLAYCKDRNRRPDFKEETLKPIVRILGDVRLVDIRRKHANLYASERGKDAVKSGPRHGTKSEARLVSSGTVNRGLAVLKHLMTYALEQELIEVHPLARFRLQREEERALRVLTLEEERRLVACMPDLVSQAFIAILGETGLRMSEAFNLKWELVNVKDQFLTVDKTKSGKARTIPLSEFALQWLDALPGSAPFVFPWPSTGTPEHYLRYALGKGRKLAGVSWVGFHDLRHFRITQWVRAGIDLRTVQALAGHQAIQTTMRYAHFSSTHATRAVLSAHRQEASEWERATNGRQSPLVMEAQPA